MTRRKGMMVKEIVKCAIIQEGFDGLFNDDGECGCSVDQLFICGNPQLDCEMGIKAKCDCGDHDFHIVPGIPHVRGSAPDPALMVKAALEHIQEPPAVWGDGHGNVYSWDQFSAAVMDLIADRDRFVAITQRALSMVDRFVDDEVVRLRGEAARSRKLLKEYVDRYPFYPRMGFLPDVTKELGLPVHDDDGEQQEGACPRELPILRVTSDDMDTMHIGVFTTVRACIDCGVLINGGPTRCKYCVDKMKRSQ